MTWSDNGSDALGEEIAERIALLARRAHALDIAPHTVHVSQAGVLLASATCPPHGPDTPQRMYSVGKTLTGIAIGLLADEGKLSLDDPIADHFPRFAPVHPFLRATTVRHLLTMRGPHQDTTYDRDRDDWLESYFRVPPTHPPGTLFTYDTSATYVLSALVERLGGGSLAGYLRPRLLDPIGVSPGLRFLPGPDGVEQGGSGLLCTADDLIRIAHLLLADGVHGTDRLVPADYWRDATRRQADTTQQTWGDTLRQGYGYHLWLPGRGGWLMFGMGGQIVYGDPAHDLAVVVTADSQACAAGDHRLLDDVMDLLVAPLTTDARTGAKAGSAGADAQPTSAGSRTLAWPTPRHVPSPTGTRIRRHRFSGTRRAVLRTSAPAVPASTVHRAGTRPDPGPGPSRITVTTDDDGGGARIRTAHLPAGSDREGPDAADVVWDLTVRFGEAVEAAVAGRPAVVTAGMPDADTLDLRLALRGEDLTTWRVRLAWAPDGVLAVRSQAFGESADPSWTFHAAYAPAEGVAGP